MQPAKLAPHAALALLGLIATFFMGTSLAAPERAAVLPLPPPAQASIEALPHAGDELRIGLLTIGPGEIYWQRFGHNAIWIADSASQTERLYNFGIFDFFEQGFLVNFIAGRMTYRLVAGDPEPELALYRSEGRSIEVQWLDLPPAARRALRDALDLNALPHNAAYRYDYFADNCSTRVRDALNRATDGAIESATRHRSRGFTERMHALRLTAAEPWLYLGIDVGLGPSADQPLSFYQEMFIPMRLSAALKDVVIERADGSMVPLLAQTQRLAEARVPQPPALPPVWLWRFLLLGLGIAVALWWLSLAEPRHWRRRLLGAGSAALWLASGIGGLALTYLAFFSEHRTAHGNENIALFNPLALLLLPIAWHWCRGRRAHPSVTVFIAGLIAACAFWIWLAKVLPGIRQDNLNWIALWLPIHAMLCAILIREGKTAQTEELTAALAASKARGPCLTSLLRIDDEAKRSK